MIMPLPRRTRASTPQAVLGVDGCPAGWVAVALAGDACEAWVHRSFDELLQSWPAAAVIAVDMPIGLVARGWRSADAAARRFLAELGRPRASVFEVPPRRALRATSHAEACRLSRAHAGKGISIQAFHLFPKILEVDRHARDARLIEVHPEVSFAIMARGRVALASKKTREGATARRRLLSREGIRIPAQLATTPGVGIDDILDAAAAAWSGRRWLRGEALELPPASPDLDACGRVIRVVA
jgi:predicted RNase H-like nuclease